ncbi:MAG TPA: Hsp20/alpha crystallin family protein, partial [Acidimicrobiales bacterium]|nr:Hsp20/alpha crystallin family protein [Acidimicrobiales bacterium]
MLMRFDPFAELDRLASQTWNRGLGASGDAFMPMDAYRSGDHYVVHLDLPGVDPESVDLTVEHNVLSISAQRAWKPEEGTQVLFAERPQGSFTRKL